MRSPPSVATGLFAGRYAIEREIGQGASAIVYLARDTQAGTAVALKILRPELAESRASDRFLREIKRTSALQHPNILPVLDAGEHEGQLYFALPYMEGGTLRQLLKREKHLELSRVIAIGRTVAEALDYAHERGLIHRDVKPENILFTNGVACLGDFGIARAIDLSGSGATGTTSRNVVRGTAAYMSPEQAAGSDTLDGRSDVFSLACVIYEMITGMQAYIGPTDEAVIAQRFIHPPRDVRVYRSTSPSILNDAVQKAFAITPADRYRSATQLVQALVDAIAEPVGSTGEVRRTPLVSRARPRGVLVASVVLTLLAGAFAAWASTDDVPVDPETFVVLPFNHAGRLDSGIIDGASAGILAYDALRRWSDIRRIDPLRVADAIIRREVAVVTLADALDLSRALRAGRLIWGDVHHQGDRVVIRGVLYDVADPDRAPREASVTIASSGAENAGELFAALIDTLVADGQPRPVTGSAHPFAAVTAYANGVAALYSWDLAAALEQFGRATTLEPSYPAANLRYAQVAQWLRRPQREWRQAALTAAGGEGDVALAERSHALALVSMADADYPKACAHFAEMTKLDSLDVAAWFGLGDCQREDRLVVPDASSPSRWRFRSSRHAAGQAYLRAFELVPTSYRAYRDMLGVRLESAFLTRAGIFREGVPADRTLGVFAAFPELVADTLAFVPYPYAELTSGKHVPRAEAVEAAMRRARDQLHALAERWVQATPDNPTAWETRTVALERAGIIGGHPDRSALGSVIRARKLSASNEASLRLATTQVRLLLKTDQFRAAGILADSIVKHSKEPTPGMAVTLASLAGLVGDWNAMDRFVERAAPVERFATLDGRLPDVDVAMTTLALRLITGALAERPMPVLRDLEDRLARHLETIPDAVERRVIREVLMRNFAMFAYPTHGPQTLHADSGGAYLVSLQASVARRDTARAHSDLRLLADQRRNAGVGRGVLAVDAGYLEASLLAQLGDTAAAVDRLDDVLLNLTAQRDWFRDLHSPAFLVKSMILRARIAELQGDTRTHEHWTTAVSSLRPRQDRTS